jgi:hypothetical protein
MDLYAQWALSAVDLTISVGSAADDLPGYILVGPVATSGTGYSQDESSKQALDDGKATLDDLSAGSSYTVYYSPTGNEGTFYATDLTLDPLTNSDTTASVTVYTVSFHRNDVASPLSGATFTGTDPTTLHYVVGQPALAIPAIPYTSNLYSLRSASWYTTSAGDTTQAVGTSALTPTANMDLYAQWQENTATVSGSVLDFSGSALIPDGVYLYAPDTTDFEGSSPLYSLGSPGSASFELTHVGDGSYLVVAKKAGYVQPYPVAATVSGQAAVGGIALVLRPSDTSASLALSGTVYSLPQGLALGDVSLTLKVAGSIAATTVSDAQSGAYSFSGLVEGTDYTVEAADKVAGGMTYQEICPLILSSLTSSSNTCDLFMQDRDATTHKASGSVYHKGSLEPMGADIKVSLYTDTTPPHLLPLSATTDASGHFSFETALAEGTYQADCAPYGIFASTGPLTFTLDSDTSANVVDATGKGLEMAAAVAITYDDNLPPEAKDSVASSGYSRDDVFGDAILSAPSVEPSASYYDFLGWSTSKDDLEPVGGWVFADDPQGASPTLLTTANGVTGSGTAVSPYKLTLYAIWAMDRDISAPLTLTSPEDIPQASQGSAYDAAISEEGSNPAVVNWSVSAGTLPGGISLSDTTSTTVHLTSPKVTSSPGSYTFTLRCTNDAGLYSEQAYTITVVLATPQVSVPTLSKLSTPAAVTLGGTGSAYSATNTGPGVRLALKAPSVSWNGGSALGQGWQSNVSGKWTSFDPLTYMSLSYNAKKLRYFATNQAGTVYSNTATITVRTSTSYPVLGGKDRIATSSLTALDAWPTGSKYAVLAIGSDFKDALVASYLAGWLDCPVLLVSAKTKDNAPIKATLTTLKVTKVYTVGSAVSDTIRKSVWTGSYTKVSPKGRDGVSEAIDVLRYVTATLKKPKPTSVLITTTSGYADAMAAAAYVANPKLNMPILYVKGKDDASKAAAEVKALGSVKTVYVLGSAKVVSVHAAKTIKSNYKRIWGADRNETAAAAFTTFSPKVAKLAKDGHLHSVGITAGNWPDALGAGAAQAHLGGAVMITPSSKVGPDVKKVLTGGTFKCGATTYKAAPIQRYLTDFCFYGKTITAKVRKTISGYIK